MPEWQMTAARWDENRSLPENFRLLPLPGRKCARTCGGMGLWPFQQCVKLWKSSGRFSGYADLDKAAAASDIEGMILPDTPELFSPENMEQAIFKLYGRELSPAEVTALLLRGTAQSIADKLASFGKKFAHVILVGGGSGGKFMRELIAAKVDAPLVFGNTEASAAGNIIIQKKVLAHLSRS